MSTVSRRTYLRGMVVSIAGTSLSGCVQSNPFPVGAEQDRDIEERVQFRELRWRPTKPADVWSLRAELVNLSGDSLRVECVLTIDGVEYGEVFELEPWGSETIYLITDIPDFRAAPGQFELRAYQVEVQTAKRQPLPTRVLSPEKYARIIDDYLEPDWILPKIHGVTENISEVQLKYVKIEGTFFVGDRAAEATNTVMSDVLPGEQRAFDIPYFRGNEARQVDGYEVEVMEVFL